MILTKKSIAHLAGLIIQDAKKENKDYSKGIDSSRMRGNSSRATPIKQAQSTRDDKNKSCLGD